MSDDRERLCRFTVDGFDKPFPVDQLTSQLGLGAPGYHELVVVVPKNKPVIDLVEELLGKQAKIEWDAGDGRKTWPLRVDEVFTVENGLKIVAVPELAWLSDCVNYRVFLDEDAVAIVKQVLGDHQVSLDDQHRQTLPKRDQCIQNFESDLDFVSRILADEGIVWFVDPESPDKVILADEPSAFTPLAVDTFTVYDNAALAFHDNLETAFEVKLDVQVVTQKVTLRDYNFKKPALDLTVNAQAGNGKLEHYEYRGPYADPADGKRLAKNRLEELRRDERVLSGSTIHRGLLPGHTIELDDGQDTEISGKWLLTEVRTEVSTRRDAQAFGYRVQFKAVPATSGFRPHRREVPRVPSAQTVRTTGSSGSEIHPDEHGRIKAHLRWDRIRPDDDTSSAFWRVTQPPTSGGFFLPRVGWEQLVSFWGGSADYPQTIGRLYNGAATPPSGLPARKVETAYGTLTTPGGGTAHRVAFDDTAGNEGMHFNCSYDFNEKTEKDKVTSVKVNETTEIGVNRTAVVGKVHEVVVTGSQTYSVGAKRDVGVQANKMIHAGSETVTIGAARIFDIGGDQQTESASLVRVVGAAKAIVGIEHESILVAGASTRLYGGAWAQIAGLGVAVTVGGACQLNVGGLKAVKAAEHKTACKKLTENLASRTEKASEIVHDGTSDIGVEVAGACTLKGSDVVFEASSEIDIKADGVHVTIAPSKVTIKGKYESSQGSADSADESYD